jgi:hypothetical protein
MNHMFEMTIAQGLDMTLVIGLIIALDDKTLTNNAAAAEGAGGGGALLINELG